MNKIINRYIKYIFVFSFIGCISALATEEGESSSKDKETASSKRKVESAGAKERRPEPSKEAKTRSTPQPKQRPGSVQQEQNVERQNHEAADWYGEAEKVMDYLEGRDKIESGEYKKSDTSLDH
jgi:hypothetical protein